MAEEENYDDTEPGSEDIYDDSNREQQEEDAEISPQEEAFVKGYEDDESETIKESEDEEED